LIVAGYWSLTEGIDTTTSFGRFYFTMAAALAQLEHDRLIERTRAGLVAAKARGRTGGRKPKLSPDQVEMARGLLDGGKPPRDVAKAFGVGRSTLYRAIGARAGDDVKAAAQWTKAAGRLRGRPAGSVRESTNHREVYQLGTKCLL
jgi:DNA invertase Pin-like site-specific DNA recombinase